MIVNLDCERPGARGIIPLTLLQKMFFGAKVPLVCAICLIPYNGTQFTDMYRFQPGRTNIWMHRFTRGPRMHAGTYALTLAYVYPHSHPNIRIYICSYTYACTDACTQRPYALMHARPYAHRNPSTHAHTHAALSRHVLAHRAQ